MQKLFVNANKHNPNLSKSKTMFRQMLLKEFSDGVRSMDIQSLFSPRYTHRLVKTQ